MKTLVGEGHKISDGTQKDIVAYQLEAARLFLVNNFSGIRAAITGSLGLFIHGFDLGRNCGDIDIIAESLSKKVKWETIKLPKPFTAEVYKSKTQIFEYEFEVHVIVWKGFETVQKHNIEVGSLQEIIDAKLDFALSGTQKHIRDFHKIITQLIK